MNLLNLRCLQKPVIIASGNDRVNLSSEFKYLRMMFSNIYLFSQNTRETVMKIFFEDNSIAMSNLMNCER